MSDRYAPGSGINSFLRNPRNVTVDDYATLYTDKQLPVTGGELADGSLITRRVSNDVSYHRSGVGLEPISANRSAPSVRSAISRLRKVYPDLANQFAASMNELEDVRENFSLTSNAYKVLRNMNSMNAVSAANAAKKIATMFRGRESFGITPSVIRNISKNYSTGILNQLRDVMANRVTNTSYDPRSMYSTLLRLKQSRLVKESLGEDSVASAASTGIVLPSENGSVVVPVENVNNAVTQTIVDGITKAAGSTAVTVPTAAPTVSPGIVTTSTALVEPPRSSGEQNEVISTVATAAEETKSPAVTAAVKTLAGAEDTEDRIISMIFDLRADSNEEHKALVEAIGKLNSQLAALSATSSAPVVVDDVDDYANLPPTAPVVVEVQDGNGDIGPTFENSVRSTRAGLLTNGFPAAKMFNTGTNWYKQRGQSNSSGGLMDRFKESGTTGVLALVVIIVIIGLCFAMFCSKPKDLPPRPIPMPIRINKPAPTQATAPADGKNTGAGLDELRYTDTSPQSGEVVDEYEELI